MTSRWSLSSSLDLILGSLNRLKTDILFQVTLKEEEMERAEKIEKYVLEETNKWNLIDDKQLVLLRCQVFGIC